MRKGHQIEDTTTWGMAFIGVGVARVSPFISRALALFIWRTSWYDHGRIYPATNELFFSNKSIIFT